MTIANTITADHLFKLELADYDYQYNFYFIGPADFTAQKFEALCHLLFPEAALLAVAAAQKVPETDRRYIGSKEITEQLILLLVPYQFSFLPNGLKTAVIIHDSIISEPLNPDLEKILAYSREAVIEYNDSLTKFYDQKSDQKLGH